MIEEYIKILESFKHNQISKVIEHIDAKIFDVLYSKHVSTRITPYFPRYELCFMSDETIMEPGKVYLREQQGKIAYSVITPNGKPIKDVLLEELNAPELFKYKLAPMLNTEKLESGVFYVHILDKGLEYTVVDPQGKPVIKALIKKEVLKARLGSDLTGLSAEDLEPFIPEILKITSKRNHTLPFVLTAFRGRVLSATARAGHTKWYPFTDYSLDPDNISQIKKLLNALYYARLTFLDLENVNVREKYLDVKFLYDKTINLAYEASYLATHLDIDLRDIFNEELALLLPLLTQIQNFAENHAEEKNILVKSIQPIPLACRAGEASGIVIDQMKPISGDVDFNFLTQFSAVLPSYIDKLTQSIKQYSSQITETEPNFNDAKLEELQNAALSLLNEIENLKGNSVFVSLKFLNYIHIIRNIITLSTSSVEQIGELSDSSQDLVRDKLAQLKYVVLPTLFGLVDKIEANSMLKPGTLSIPLMKKVKILYETLLSLSQKAIDFKTKGEELLEIEDSQSIDRRLEMSYKRVDKANKALYKIKKAQDACEQFFKLLNNPDYKNYCLHQLPPEVKRGLIQHYKLLQPYMTKLDLDLNQLIIDKLNGSEKESLSSFVGRHIRRARKMRPQDHIDFVLAKENALRDLITKEEHSQVFHIHLNKDLIETVNKQARLVLLPYSEKTSIYTIDESVPLQIEPEKEKKFKLLKADVQHIINVYTHFGQIIKKQIAKNPAFDGHELDLDNLDSPIKKKCHKLYKIFHPYLAFFGVKPELKEFTKNLDHYLSSFFADKTTLSKEPPAVALYLQLDKNIQNFFTHIHFELMDKAEFQTIFTAYTRFSHLLKNHIKEKPQLFGSNLALNNLDKATKEKCRDLYKIFQPYLTLIIPAELKNSAQNFERYISAFLADKPLDILEAPTSALFLQLDEKALEFFNKWQDKSNHYYDFTKDRLLSEQESNNLRIKREKDEKLHFKIIENNKLLQNPNQLCADEALELWQWYENKNDKLIDAQNAYTRFIELLKNQIAADPKLQDNILPLKDMNAATKNKWRNLYNLFQPYFISAVPASKRNDALIFDKYLIALLSNKEAPSNKVPSVKLLFDMDEQIMDYFTTIDIEWKKQARTYAELTQKKFALENDATELTLDPNIGKRAHYVIKHTNYSKSIHEFRNALFKVSKLFNQTMQKELKPQRSGVPFPEMEDDNLRLAQSKHVCALKDLFNSMYHLENIALKLEKLNNKSYKSFYVSYLLQAYGHLNEILKLSKRLGTDPHLGFIARDLIDKAQTLYATFQEHSDAYQVSHEQIPSDGSKETVQYNSLWYVLNAFYINPKHIRSLKNNNYLTTEELNELHLQAKKASLFIEGLINSSDSYFKLFLQTHHMVYLYQELTKKLNEFTSTSHDTTINHLNKIRATIITPMLLEADRWENRLGLAPGTLSGPLRQITDEFFKGLIQPLDLNSALHIALVCDKEPLEKRTSVIKKQMSNTQKYLKKIEKEYKDIKDLYQAYLIYKDSGHFFPSPAYVHTRNSENIVPSDDDIQKDKERLQTAYKKALPKLTRLKLEKKIEIPTSQYPEDHELDALCNSGLKDYDRHHTEIEALIKASHHYYLGLKKTREMWLKTAEEKLSYLTELSQFQEKETLIFVEKYTTEAFDKHLEALCNRHIGLQYTDKEYRTKLKEYLLHSKTKIIASSKKAEDIDLNIKILLKEQISKFENKHYVDYYHLDALRVAIAQFKIYFSYSTVAIENQGSLFESKTTLAKKTLCINNLDSIAEDSKMTIKERYDAIKKGINDPNFSRIILAHQQMDTVSFNYLKMLCLSLLETLHLYVPTRKRLLSDINDAINNPPELSELTQRFGLFATNEVTKRYESATQLLATPTV